MAKVTLDKLTKIYLGKKESGVTAVDGIGLEIEDGEFIVLVGPSGCGKSTTLRMIAGLEEISGGTLSIDGRIVNDVLPKDRDIAMVFQNYALYPHMSVRENMAFGLKLRKLPAADIDQRVGAAAGLLGLGPMLDRLPKSLSGGQRQRVSVGRLSGSQRCFCLMSRSRILTRTCGSPPGRKSPSCTRGSAPL
jgi:multiple sugar transport system ATP-binding protein